MAGGRFSLRERLGSGAFGEVLKVSHNDSGALLALKVTLVTDQENPASAEHEARVMAECACPNVVRMFEHWQEICPESGARKQFLLMELCSGTLRKMINDYRDNNHSFGINMIRYLALGITRGLAFIHSKGFIHRDIKPETILLSHESVPKICDFGLSTMHRDGSVHTPNVGTMRYRSPEVLLRSTSYTQAVDCWALGCTIAELFHGEPLFDAVTTFGLLAQIAEHIGLIDRTSMPGDIDVPMLEALERPAFSGVLAGLVATWRDIADPNAQAEFDDRYAHCSTSVAFKQVLLATDIQQNDFSLSLGKLHYPGSDRTFLSNYMKQYRYWYIVSAQKISLYLLGNFFYKHHLLVPYYNIPLILLYRVFFSYVFVIILFFCYYIFWIALQLYYSFNLFISSSLTLNSLQVYNFFSPLFCL